jgi:hypothetical protein
MSDLRLTFYPIGDSYLAVGAAAVVLLALLAIGPARSKISRPRRTVLLALRLAAIAVLLLAMLRPTLVYTRVKRQEATVVLLADRSRSMSVPDEADGKSRWEAQYKAWEQARPALRDLEQEFQIKAYTFDDQVHPAEIRGGRIELGEEPDGRQTAIGAVLEDILRQQAGKRVLGIVLSSDGAQRAYPPRDELPQTAADRLKYLGWPLYTVRFGQARGLGQARDVAIKELSAAERVFVNNELSITGQLRADGYVNREIPVQVLFETSPGKMEPVAQQTVRIQADGQLVPLRFSYIPLTPGEYKLTLEAVQQPGELVTTNNRLSTFVNVLKGGLRVLYLEGAARPESGFLRRSLDASREIRLDFVRLDARRPDTRPADFSQWFQPGKYDVYILGDLDATAFKEPEMTGLAEAVSRGAGLIMLGGLHSFGPGGYAGTPLADVLPVELKSNERQRFDEPIASDLHLPGPLRMRPRPGLTHFALSLAVDPEESRRLWSQLPPLLDGANRFRVQNLKPGALVLAQAADDQPLLVAQSFGAGRVMAFAGDSTWRWCLHGFEAAHKRFWRQVVLWLARKDESMEGMVWIKLAERRLAPNRRVEFSVGAQSPQGEPLKQAQFKAEVVLPDGSTRPVQLVQGEEQTSGSVRDTEAAGDYTVRVTATSEGKEVGRAQARFLVVEEDLELDNPAADATVLDSLAMMTGGKSLAPEELPDLFRRLAKDTQSLLVQTESKQTFWDTWPFFLLLVGLLGTEWYLRKRWSLV